MKTPINQEELDKAARKQLKKDDFVDWQGITKVLYSTYQGRAFWTNREALFFAEVPTAALIYEPKECDIEYLDPTPYISSSETDIEVFPCFTFDGDLLAVVLLEDSQKIVVSMQAKYFGYLVKHFGKKLTYKVNYANKHGTIRVYKKGEIIAAISPLYAPENWKHQAAFDDKLYMARLKELATA